MVHNMCPIRAYKRYYILVHIYFYYMCGPFMTYDRVYNQYHKRSCVKYPNVAYIRYYKTDPNMCPFRAYKRYYIFFYNIKNIRVIDIYINHSKHNSQNKALTKKHPRVIEFPVKLYNIIKLDKSVIF